MELKEVIDQCIKNDKTAQERLYKLLSSKLFAVCLKYSRNYEEAQDNLQDGFILLFNKLNQFQYKGSFEGWAKRIFINNILQKYRSPGILEIVTEEFPELEDVEIENENISMNFLLEIIQQLPDRYRLVFNLYVFDDYSHKEISEMLGITIGTSKSNLARARQILKDKIELHQNQPIFNLH